MKYKRFGRNGSDHEEPRVSGDRESRRSAAFCGGNPMDLSDRALRSRLAKVADWFSNPIETGSVQVRFLSLASTKRKVPVRYVVKVT